MSFALVLTVHGLIHLLGVAKAFGWASLPQLSQPIPRAAGVVWLMAALLFIGSSVALLAWPRTWWMVGAAAVATSAIAIARSWVDAKAGAAVDALALVAVVAGFLMQGPVGLRAAYERDVRGAVSRAFPAADVVREDDLRGLPEPVRRYLRLAGVVGQPRVHNFRVRMHGRIRGGPQQRWLPLEAEQHNVVGVTARFFYFTSTMVAVPLQGYHRYAGSAASMEVRAAGLVAVANASGSELTQSETVTLFNDMCVLAPAALIDPGIEWRSMSDATVAARFSHAGHSIRARLFFNADGELVDFSSDDRYEAVADGRGFRRVPWSTPLGRYRAFGAMRLAASGEGRWRSPAGEYAYLQVTIDDVQYNVAAQPRRFGGPRE